LALVRVIINVKIVVSLDFIARLEFFALNILFMHVITRSEPNDFARRLSAIIKWSSSWAILVVDDLVGYVVSNSNVHPSHDLSIIDIFLLIDILHAFISLMLMQIASPHDSIETFSHIVEDHFVNEVWLFR
jgi:hypothetical protein